MDECKNTLFLVNNIDCQFGSFFRTTKNVVYSMVKGCNLLNEAYKSLGNAFVELFKEYTYKIVR